MNNFSIYFARPWLLLLLIPAVLLALVPILKLPPARRRTPNRIISLCLHLCLLVLLTLILSGVTFYESNDETQLIIVADISDSTSEQQALVESYVKQIAGQAEEDTEIGILTFANGAIYSSKLSTDSADLIDRYLTQAEQPDTSASDIAEALSAAAELMEEGKNRRIVLVSDGQQTDGDALAAAKLLAEAGIRVDAVFVDSTMTTAEAQISSLKLPEKIEAGETIQVSVTVTSNTTAEGFLELYDNDVLVKSLAAELEYGENLFAAEITIEGAGVHVIHAELVTGTDTLLTNNTMYSCVNASGAGSILIIDGTGKETEQLQELLESEYNVTVVRASRVSSYMSQLRLYDEVILMNVSNSTLPAGFDEALESYVSDFGGGLLTVGGDNTYIYGSMNGTAFEDLLPVDLVIDDTQVAAVMILIDASSSMSGSFITLAKSGAINSINSLSLTDYVGVITFSSGMKVLSEITSVLNKEEIIKEVQNLTTTRGTMLYDATYEAYQELKDFDADIKHIIILSDGNPQDSGYNRVVQLMADAGITTSTIAIGSNANTSVMKTLAELGGGRFYDVTSAADLPDVMVEETVASQGEYLNEFTFTPEIKSYTTELYGVNELPELSGYISTSLKSKASLVLGTEDNAPIYAKWDYGSGKVGSFTSDLAGTWSEPFMSSIDGQTFVRNMVAGLLADEEGVSAIYVSTEEDNYTATVQIRTELLEGERLLLTVTSPGGRKSSVTPEQISDSLYEAVITTSESGVYELAAVRSDAGGNVLDYKEVWLVSEYSLEYDAFPLLDGETLLFRICKETGGAIAAVVGDLFGTELSVSEHEVNPRAGLLIAAVVLFLMDIAVRKFPLKFLQRKEESAKGKISTPGK